jgi:hypothetical protein
MKASILSPPNDPFVATIEREILIVGLAATGWGYVFIMFFFLSPYSTPILNSLRKRWGCLGLFLANLTRVQKLSPAEAPQAAIFSGEYIEAAVSPLISSVSPADTC